MAPTLRLLAAMAVALVAPSCGGAGTCVPGRVQACACPGASGLQVCAWNGSFAACDCKGPPPSGPSGCQPPPGEQLFSLGEPEIRSRFQGDWFLCSGESFDLGEMGAAGLRIGDGQWAALHGSAAAPVVDQGMWRGHWELYLDLAEDAPIVVNLSVADDSFYSVPVFFFESDPPKVMFRGFSDVPWPHTIEGWYVRAP